MNKIPSVPPPPANEIKWQLLEAAPATDYERLIVKAPYETDRHYAAFYQESANRLAATFSGQPQDDMILLPFLGLYRQAYELALKSFIRGLAKERRRLVDSGNPDLAPRKLENKIRFDLGHKLDKLIVEAQTHWDALDLGEPIPADLVALIMSMHETDPAGTSFRYSSSNQPTGQARTDFPDLVTMLDEGLLTLWSVEDWADALTNAVPDP